MIKKANIKWNGKLTPLNLSKVEGIALHHMAHPSAGIKDVDRWHKDKGWLGFGYNYWIDFDGNIYEGRGLNQGAGVANMNSRLISVGFQGDFDIQQMPQKQFEAGLWMIDYLKNLIPSIKIVEGHKYWTKTSCPGKNFPEMKGGSMKNKVMDFQRKYNLLVDGIIGPQTIGKAKEVKRLLTILGYQPDKQIIYEKISLTHTIRVDPKSLKAKLVNKSGTALKNQYKTFVNGNFFTGNKIIGWLISEGKILNERHEYRDFGGWKGNPKGTFIVYNDGTVKAGALYDYEIAEDSYKIWFCCQGFNLFPLDISKEGFSPAEVGYSTYRLSLGFDGKKAVIALRPDSDANRAVETMKNLGCNQAICLDSGGSANMQANGNAIRLTDRTLTNIIYV